MKNNTLKIFSLGRIFWNFFLVILLMILTAQSHAQGLYQPVVMKTQIINPVIKTINEQVIKKNNEIKCEGSYLVIDGQMNEIYNLKFVLPNVQLKLDSTNKAIEEKNITFEQTQVMVLPLMGMAHFVGTLKIGDVCQTSSFLLKFKVNGDQSISFIGEKEVKLALYYPDVFKVAEEVKLNVNFVLKDDKNSPAISTAE